jgi:hypothetical protein
MGRFDGQREIIFALGRNPWKPQTGSSSVGVVLQLLPVETIGRVFRSPLVSGKETVDETLEPSDAVFLLADDVNSPQRNLQKCNGRQEPTSSCNSTSF